ncbi:unnamed protein product [[Candida] boidinii]|nr:hypothetical protein B5S30_g3108 [[Candida] boidinii]GME98498.1 unnamed protein product [[Candida] boidinii]GMG04435.1 unnamed protein product [[Candida] boidinii]
MAPTATASTTDTAEIEKLENEKYDKIRNEKEKNRTKYRMEIQQMMFVSGETNDPPESTTTMIEDIVRDQVVELVLQSGKTAYSRGQRSVAPEDVIFLIRHDVGKVNRLRTYLSWKDVRKNAKDQDSADIGAGNDLVEDGPGGPGGAGANPSGIDNKMMASKQKKSQIRLPWELEFMFREQPLDYGDDEADESERETVLATLKRLKTNDDRTKNMTQKEYVHWSECRQASFTFRKGRRFREWCGFSNLIEGRPHDDVIDILGFLTFEMVCSITEEALKVKNEEIMRANYYRDHRDDHSDDNNNSDGGSDDDDDREEKEEKEKKRTKMKRRHFLFDEPDDGSTQPILIEHVEEAWRRLQDKHMSKRALFNYRGGRLRNRAKLI